LSGTAPNLVYTPTANANGADSFTFKVNDGLSSGDPSSAATVSITITPVNDAPVAVAQSVTTDEDVAKPVVIAATDVDGDTLNYILVTPPTKGALSGTAPNLVYTPTANANGNDLFTFKVNDGKSDSVGATVAITIIPVNDAPVAVAQSISATKNTARSVVLGESTDVDNDSLTYTVLTQPTHGTLSGSGKDRSYTPNSQYVGSDSLTFKVSDGTVESGVVTINISVQDKNDPPVAIAQTISTDEDTSKPIILSGTDPDENTLSYIVVGQPTQGTLTGSGANRIYTPNLNANGADTFTFKVNDGTVDSPVVTVSISIAAVNDIPVAVAQTISLDEDATRAVLLTGTDVENAALSFAVVTQPTKGVLSGTAPNLTYTPTANANGSDSFTFKVNDGAVDSVVATVAINIAAVNDAPAALAQSVTTSEDIAKPIVLAGTDPDSDSLTFEVVSQPSKGALSGSVPNLIYTPNANANGSDSFSFKVNDGKGDSAVATVSISITAVNDEPVAVAQSVSTLEDIAKAIVLVGSDVDSDPLSYIAVNLPIKGVLSGTGANLTYTPNANVNGSDSFSYKVNDGQVDSAVVTVSVSIAAVNDVPVATAQSVTTPEETAKAILLAGTDVEGDALSFAIVTQPAKGTLSGTPPNLVYTPNANLSGSDSFAFRVRDGVND